MRQRGKIKKLVKRLKWIKVFSVWAFRCDELTIEHQGMSIEFTLAPEWTAEDHFA